MSFLLSFQELIKVSWQIEPRCASIRHNICTPPQWFTQVYYSHSNHQYLLLFYLQTHTHSYTPRTTMYLLLVLFCVILNVNWDIDCTTKQFTISILYSSCHHTSWINLVAIYLCITIHISQGSYWLCLGLFFKQVLQETGICYCWPDGTPFQSDIQHELPSRVKVTWSPWNMSALDMKKQQSFLQSQASPWKAQDIPSTWIVGR